MSKAPKKQEHQAKTLRAIERLAMHALLTLPERMTDRRDLLNDIDLALVEASALDSEVLARVRIITRHIVEHQAEIDRLQQLLPL